MIEESVELPEPAYPPDSICSQLVAAAQSAIERHPSATVHSLDWCDERLELRVCDARAARVVITVEYVAHTGECLGES